jgi:hypothetical protein
MGNAVKARWKLYDRVQKKLDLILSIEERDLACDGQEHGTSEKVDLRFDC